MGGPLQLGDDRTDLGPAAGGRVVLQASGHALMGGVAVLGPDDGSQEHQLVGDLGQAGEMLADLNAGNVGGDGLELPANLRGGVHFELEHVLVRGAAREIDHDDGLAGLAQTGLALGPQQLRHGQSTHAQGPDLDEVAPVNPVAKPLLLSMDGEHNPLPPFPELQCSQGEWFSGHGLEIDFR